MKDKKKLLFWIPRILSILFILFLSLFATDVFNEYTFPDVLLALFMHLIPSFVLLAILVLSWKNDLCGGSLYFLGWIGFLLFFWNREHLGVQFLLFSPLLVTSLMFFVSYLINKRKSS